MAFFEKLGETLTNASNSVAQKTQNFAEVNNLNKAVSSNQTAIQNMYVEIGRLYYEAHKEDADAEYASQCQIINDAFVNINSLQEQIRVIKGIAVCPNCGAEVANDSAFCAKCGSQIVAPVNNQGVNQTPVQPEVVQQPTIKNCAKCMSQVPVDSAFCPVCGERM